MSFTPLNPPGFPAPLAPYSTATRAGNTLYVSGILPLGEDGRCVGMGDARVQTRQVLDTIAKVLEAAGGSLRDIAFNQIFLKDMGDYAAMNEVYGKYFPEQPPARYCIQAALVRPEFLVEIAATAHLEG